MRRNYKLPVTFVCIFAVILFLASYGKDDPKMLTATLSVECCNALEENSGLPDAIREILPKDGIIFPSRNITFKEGESVFDILSREMKNAGVLMESTFTPGYGSAYIEGIGNLYEFDCGELSGWMYKVNGQFPNYGCSSSFPEDKAIIEWVYTCNMGEDVGNAGFSGYKDAPQKKQ